MKGVVISSQDRFYSELKPWLDRTLLQPGKESGYGKDKTIRM